MVATLWCNLICNLIYNLMWGHWYATYYMAYFCFFQIGQNNSSKEKMDDIDYGDDYPTESDNNGCRGIKRRAIHGARIFPPGVGADGQIKDEGMNN